MAEYSINNNGKELLPLKKYIVREDPAKADIFINADSLKKKIKKKEVKRPDIQSTSSLIQAINIPGKSSIYTPASSSVTSNQFLSYKVFNISSSILISSSQRTPTSSANLYSGSIFLLSASAAYTAGANIQTFTILTSRLKDADPIGGSNISASIYYDVSPSGESFFDNEFPKSQPFNVEKVEGPIRITTGSSTSNTTGSLRIEAGRSLRIKDGGNWVVTLGCTNPNALNYNPSANVNNNSCTIAIFGCTDPSAYNYTSNASISNGSCLYQGCTDPNALNYDATATRNNGSCHFAPLGKFYTTDKNKSKIDKSYSKNKRIGSNNTILPYTKQLTTTKRTLVDGFGQIYIGLYHIHPIHGKVKGSHHPNPTSFNENAILYLRGDARNYMDNNESISKNLPQAYKKPKTQDQQCINCAFNNGGLCQKWNANIRNEYWCKSWKPLGSLSLAGITFRNKYPGRRQYGLNTTGNEFFLANKKYFVGSYDILPDGKYITSNSQTPLLLKNMLKNGPLKHFTLINQTNIKQKQKYTPPSPQTTSTQITSPSTIKPQTTNPQTTNVQTTSGAGTSYSY